ncbi:MAG TPA: cation-transporting P-type ATPase [Solirubrobacteraceae bacterium]|nr:cation-transporting P-type ATPase [Solirubrobacteraceae bacterium]
MSEPAPTSEVDAEQAVDLLLRDLRSSREGLSTREAQRRLVQYGPNELRHRGGWRWPGELARQLTHPLALLLWLAAGLSLAVGSQTVAIAVLLVIVLNAAFAFIQELQAGRAVEALARYMPQHATVLRDRAPQVIEATGLIPGDIVVLAEGDRIAADMRLLSGALEVDLSTLTGESVPALRSAELQDSDVPRLAARDLIFSGTSATGGEAHAVVFATGMHTELGRIAALSERVKAQPSPLERQVRRVAWLIAAIAVGMAVAFVPLAIFGAGLAEGQRRVCRRPACGERARGSAAGDHTRARGRREPARTPWRARQAPERRGDARLDRRDLHRQDRNAHREQDATGGGVDAGGSSGAR